MAGRSNLGPNCVDTEQIFDGCVTINKFGADAVAAMLAMVNNITAGARTFIKTAALDCTATGIVVVPICTVPANSLVTNVITVTTVALNGTGSCKIGDVAHDDGFIPVVTKTLNAVTGDDPASCGQYLWTTGAYTGGSLSAGSQTKTAADFALSALHVDAGTHNMDTHTQAGVGGDWTVTQGTLTPAAITVWGAPRQKFYAVDTIVNGTTVKGTNTTGTVAAYVFYQRMVMP